LAGFGPTARLGFASLLLVAPGAPLARGAVPPPEGPPARVEPFAIETSAWQLVWTDLEGDGAEEILYASYSGRLTVQAFGAAGAGAVRWRVELEGFPFFLGVHDLDGDGKREVLAASSSGALRVFGADGALRWSWASPDGAAVLAVAAGHLLARDAVHVAVASPGRAQDERGGEVVLLDARGRAAGTLPVGGRRIRSLAAGDLDGDGLDELLVAQGFRAFALFDPRRRRAVWEKPHEQSFYLVQALLADLDRDGKAEALIGGNAEVSRVDATGAAWTRPASPGDPGRGYRMAQLAPVDLDGDGRDEIAVLHGPALTVYGRDGALRYSASAWDYFFNAIAPSPRPHARELLLGSVTGADRNVYRVRFGGEGPDEIAGFREPPGHRARLQETLWKLRERVLAAPRDETAPRQTVYLEVAGGSPRDLARVAGLAEELARIRKAYPYENVRFFAYVGHRLAGTAAGGQPLAELMAFAEEYEKRDVLHVLAVGHALDRSMTPAAVDAWLARAPRTCLGLVVSELSADRGLLATERRPPGHRDLDSALRFRSYLDYVAAITDAAARRGKLVLPMMKNSFWITTPAARSVADTLYTKERRRSIVPWDEPSNQWAPENDLAARVGLWRTGFFPAWAFKIIDDQLSLGKDFFYTQVDPHATLRHAVAYGAAGATWFGVGKTDYLFRDERELFDLRVGELRQTPYGMLARDTLIHLLGKGLLQVPRPHEIVGTARVGFRFDEPHTAFLIDNAISAPPLPRPTEGRDGLFSGFTHPFGPTPPAYAHRILLGTRRFGHRFLPENPFGLPILVPAWYPTGPGDGVERWWETDGVYVLEEGKRKTASAMRGAIAESFEASARGLPVRASDCFWMAARRPDGRLRVTLVDPDYLEPADREVELVAEGPIASLRDVLTAESLPFEGRTARLVITAGAFRIVDVELARPAGGGAAPEGG
jgi:hypothetical protein